jgi:hypothetical protein
MPDKKLLPDDMNLVITIQVAYGAAREQYNDEIQKMEKKEQYYEAKDVKSQMEEIFAPDCGGLGFVEIQGIRRGSRLHNIFKEFCENKSICLLSDTEYGGDYEPPISVFLRLEEFPSKYHQCINPSARAHQRFIDILKKHQENFKTIDKDVGNLIVDTRLD